MNMVYFVILITNYNRNWTYNKAMKDKHKASEEGDPDVSPTISNIGEQTTDAHLIGPVQNKKQAKIN